MKNLRTNPLFIKAIGVFLTFSLVGTVLGLHRLWMQKQLWWLHPVAFFGYVVASKAFFLLNVEPALKYYATKNHFPGIADYEYKGLLLVCLGWLGFVLYDLFTVWFWPAPAPAAKESGNV